DDTPNGTLTNISRGVVIDALQFPCCAVPPGTQAAPFGFPGLRPGLSHLVPPALPMIFGFAQGDRRHSAFVSAVPACLRGKVCSCSRSFLWFRPRRTSCLRLRTYLSVRCLYQKLWL